MVMTFTLVSVTQDFLTTIIERITAAKDETKRLAEIELQIEEEKKVCITLVSKLYQAPSTKQAEIITSSTLQTINISRNS